MLNRFSKLSKLFSSAHHPQVVALDLNTNWVKDANIDDSLSLINGFTEQNYHEHELADEYPDLRDYSEFSHERIFFSDLHYVKPENEPLLNEPHGYMTSDDVYTIEKATRLQNQH